MSKYYMLVTGILVSLFSFAQKKPLDHSVYDSWQSITDYAISNDGKWVTYTVSPQQGDGELIVQSTDGNYKKAIPRAYDPAISADSRIIIFKIKPAYQATRQARISKKKPDEMPKDSLGFVEPGKDSVYKTARVKSYKMPRKGAGWAAWHMEKPVSAVSSKDTTRRQPGSAIDSLQKIIDSLNNRINSQKQKVKDDGYGDAYTMQMFNDADEDGTDGATTQEASDLVLRNISTGKQIKLPNVVDYYFNETGRVLVLKTGVNRRDSVSRQAVVWYSLAEGKSDTISRGGNDFKNIALDEQGTQLAFVAERDSSAKALLKFYKLWYYKTGMDSAVLLADRNHSGIMKGFTVSENAIPFFSKDGKKIFFGTIPVPKAKDTTLIDFELARLDVWNYKDDYLQPQQLKRLPNDLRKSYLAVVYPDNKNIVQLGDPYLDVIIPAAEGNGEIALATSNKESRKEQQWKGRTLETAYTISIKDGTKKLVKEKLDGFFNLSPNGKYVFWYDRKARHYYTYNTSTGQVNAISVKIKTPLYEEDDDHPDYPPPHGYMRWHEDDRYVYLYDKYDIWKVDPDAKADPTLVTEGLGRKQKISYRYINIDREQRFIKEGQKLLLSTLNESDRTNGFMIYKLGDAFNTDGNTSTHAFNFDDFFKAKDSEVYGYFKSGYSLSPSLTIITRIDSNQVPAGNKPGYTKYIVKETKALSAINAQQQEYNWYTAELVKWKMFDGKESKGILYKPENFDSSKKYPIIFYFYERDSDSMYRYMMPQPVRSSINIPYYVSNGYLVFDPNIYYKNGEPGESAYNSVVSAAKYLGRFKWVDTTKMGLQGHSWGGYQVAYLITRTNKFAAAEAGAPVANMTSAYGGIRWSTGVSRQFQYERTQSRIGATLWEKPELYIKNSPLFKADKINTPLLMMHNDADGAVPWYQGIEMFSALKRLDKKVWLIQYNGEDHGLLERRNRKDWSVRMSQFFDHYLKGAPAPKWLTDGVPATEKGKEWGLETEKKKI